MGAYRALFGSIPLMHARGPYCPLRRSHGFVILLAMAVPKVDLFLARRSLGWVRRYDLGEVYLLVGALFVAAMASFYCCWPRGCAP